jgi:hypothetical protein
MTRLMTMSMIARPTSMTRRRLRRDRRPPPAPQPGLTVEPEPELQVSDQRDGDRPQDEATYRCGCGYVFTAAVSTSVDCPYCGDAQAW